MNIKENYQQYVSRYAAEVAALKRKNTGFITGELLAFGGILAFLVCYFALDGDTQNYLMGAALCLIAYLGIRRLDDKNKEKIEHLSALLKVYQDEIKALEGDFSPFETGDSYQNPQHPYSFDLDVFGKSSLFNRICRTITSGGSEALARNLTRETPLTMEDIKRRRDLQKELAGEGATEDSAMSSAEGQVQNLKYKATFPLLLNISSEPTYFIALKDDAGLVKKYAMVNVQKYQIVAIGDTVSACEDAYVQLMYENGIKVKDENVKETESISGKITKIVQGVVDGNSHYYMMLEKSDEIFDISVIDYIDVIKYNVGDEITLEYQEGKQTNTVINIK